MVDVQWCCKALLQTAQQPWRHMAWCSGPGDHSTVIFSLASFLSLYQYEHMLLAPSIGRVLYPGSFQRQQASSPSRMHFLRVGLCLSSTPISLWVPQREILCPSPRVTPLFTLSLRLPLQPQALPMGNAHYRPLLMRPKNIHLKTDWFWKE